MSDELKRYIYSPDHKQYVINRSVNIISVVQIKTDYLLKNGFGFSISTDFTEYIIIPHPIQEFPPIWEFEGKRYKTKTPEDTLNFYNVLNWHLIEKKLK